MSWTVSAFLAAALTAAVALLEKKSLEKERVAPLAASLSLATLVIALFVTMIGGELRHEHNLGRKILACVIMVVGAALVVS